ncbi:DUF1552 domain-containing protein [Tundrisphaera lichenicola]|uniref:DUF1552 domain-containing protein n=1 Tax=Tundrisphaera lichenicola TaxID=2029860 RepID=UPI003EBF19D0
MKPISRRTVLRGLGTAVALPWLEAMTPVVRGASAAASPRRMAFLYVPNGVNMPDWTPAAPGALGAMPEILQPLDPFKDDLLVLTGLTQDGGRSHGDGPGDHARSMASFLTGVHPRKTSGLGIQAGVSVDQFAAQRIGGATRLPSIELGIDRGAQSGDCDSGYSCAYSSNISWRSASTPMAKEVNPKAAFERLFGDQLSHESAEARARREKYRKSVLDFVAEDARRLQGKLGQADRQKVDEYLTSVRELEGRMNRVDQAVEIDLKGVPRPAGVPEDNREHIRLMFDVLALAFQADSTRIATFAFANEASGKSYKFIGVPEGHHDLSHHGKDPEKLAKIKKINTYHIEQFAYFLEKLRSIREGEGTVLDHSMIVYGSGLSDGDRHNHDDLPILVAGKAGGTIRPSRHLVYPANTPLNNLYLSMLERVGVATPAIGDGTAPLPKLGG